MKVGGGKRTRKRGGERGVWENWRVMGRRVGERERPTMDDGWGDKCDIKWSAKPNPLRKLVTLVN